MPLGLGTLAMIGGGAIAAAGFIPIAIGFGTAGVVAGSIAAATQTYVVQTINNMLDGYAKSSQLKNYAKSSQIPTYVMVNGVKYTLH